MRPATTYENFAVGTRVRSFDFPGRFDCYVEGRVVAIANGCYRIRIDTRIVGGQPKPVDGWQQMAEPPLNGQESIFGGRLTHGVTLADQNVWHAEDPTSPHRNAA